MNVYLYSVHIYLPRHTYLYNVEGAGPAKAGLEPPTELRTEAERSVRRRGAMLPGLLDTAPLGRSGDS